jgi:hypothetical protein
MVGDVRRQLGLVEPFRDWMGTGGRRPGDGGARLAPLTHGCGTESGSLVGTPAVSATRVPPDQRAACLGRGKGASRPFGIGLRPTLPSTSASRTGRVVGSAGECGRRAALSGWLHRYNHHRPHTALGNLAPITRCTNLPGQYI